MSDIALPEPRGMAGQPRQKLDAEGKAVAYYLQACLVGRVLRVSPATGLEHLRVETLDAEFYELHSGGAEVFQATGGEKVGARGAADPGHNAPGFVRFCQVEKAVYPLGGKAGEGASEKTEFKVLTGVGFVFQAGL